MTQLERARDGEITPQMRSVAARERIDPELLRDLVASGRVVIPCNRGHANLEPCGIGAGLRTKVNANLGTSPNFPEWEREIPKLETALACGADAVMDLSTGGDIGACRRQVLERSAVPVGTVPIYEAAVRALRQTPGGSASAPASGGAAPASSAVVKMTADDMFAVIAEQAAAGVDFMTVHSGVTRRIVERLQDHPRVLGIVSRGGAILAGWMLYRGEENPLYAQFDRLLDIAREYDVTLSLGDGLRPGCLADATDTAQIEELMTLGELVQRSRAAGVQVMVEGPGHIPFDQIEANVRLQKRLCDNAPFYVLGPLVTDAAPGYDHITAAIGGALAAVAGADFLCYVTPAEHLGLPTLEDVRDGVMASRIAAHAADIVKGNPEAIARDRQMAEARASLDWSRQIALALDPAKASRMRQDRNPEAQEACSMCGDLCAIKLVNSFLGRGGKSVACY
jgi:phosphomethylpyrimidine synthase